MQSLGDLVTISVDFSILYAECPPYFNFRFVWPTDLESIPHSSTPMSIIPTKFEVVTLWPCDLDLWLFDVEQLTYMAGHETNLATKFEDPTPIRPWIMSYNVSRWLPLKMRTRPLGMRRITWPVSIGSKTVTFFLESPIPICLFTIDFHRRHYNTFALPCECVITVPTIIGIWQLRLKNREWFTFLQHSVHVCNKKQASKMSNYWKRVENINQKWIAE